MNIWGNIFTRLYDRIMARTEVGGLTERRRALLARATGDVLEIGGGTGVNAALLPPGIASLTITEPEAPMRERLARRLAEPGVDARLVAAPAERLPFPDDSFDTVVSTLVLCTVGDPAAALAEIRRVLRPDGRLLFIEHVRAVDEPRRARLQDRVQPVGDTSGTAVTATATPRRGSAPRASRSRRSTTGSCRRRPASSGR